MDVTRRTIADLLEHLGDAVNLPRDPGDLGTDDETAALIRHVARSLDPEPVLVEIERSVVYVVPVFPEPGESAESIQERGRETWERWGPHPLIQRDEIIQTAFASGGMTPEYARDLERAVGDPDVEGTPMFITTTTEETECLKRRAQQRTWHGDHWFSDPSYSYWAALSVSGDGTGEWSEIAG